MLLRPSAYKNEEGLSRQLPYLLYAVKKWMKNLKVQKDILIILTLYLRRTQDGSMPNTRQDGSVIYVESLMTDAQKTMNKDTHIIVRNVDRQIISMLVSSVFVGIFILFIHTDFNQLVHLYVIHKQMAIGDVMAVNEFLVD